MNRRSERKPGEHQIRILFLEDDPNDFELAMLELRKAGLTFGVKRVENESAFCAELDASPDIILAGNEPPKP